MIVTVKGINITVGRGEEEAAAKFVRAFLADDKQPDISPLPSPPGGLIPNLPGMGPYASPMSPLRWSSDDRIDSAPTH